MYNSIFTPDASGKTMHIERGFKAPRNLVWKAWTDPEMLDQWWAPEPYKAITESMDFRIGGRWCYRMRGPEGDQHFCIADYLGISDEKSYEGLDAFCDEAWNKNTDFPSMHWYVSFEDLGDDTLVKIKIEYPSAEAMKQIIDMGFKEGFTMAHGNLDRVLASLLAVK